MKKKTIEKELKQFKFRIRRTQVLTATVEAFTLEEAQQKASTLDFIDEGFPETVDWEICSSGEEIQ